MPPNASPGGDTFPPLHLAAPEARRPSPDYICAFRPGSKLQQYLADEASFSARFFSLEHILFIFHRVAHERGLYDPRNIAILMSSPALEAAISRWAIHIDEVQNIILSQLILFPVAPIVPHVSPGPLIIAPRELERSYPSAFHSFVPSVPLPTVWDQAEMASEPVTASSVPDDRRFMLSDDLRAVFERCSHFGPLAEWFSWGEALCWLSDYICTNSARLFDPRNYMVCICKGDRLGTALAVDAFHRAQVWSLLLKQLLPERFFDQGGREE